LRLLSPPSSAFGGGIVGLANHGFFLGGEMGRLLPPFIHPSCLVPRHHPLPPSLSLRGHHVGIHTSNFRDFLLKPELLRAVVDCGFENPSEGV
jgi:hypothetical protein